MYLLQSLIKNVTLQGHSFDILDDTKIIMVNINHFYSDIKKLILAKSIGLTR